MNIHFPGKLFKLIFTLLIIVSSLSIITFAQSDRDGDGFADDNDSCVNRGNEGGLGVDETGCPYYDADWDGVYDRDDLCPSRANEYGYGIDETGCPLTADNSLPQVTEEPLDSDGDGVMDSVDSCLWQGNEGGLGVDETGCPYYDADWDGFYDRDDACPTQGNEGGLGVDESGCPYYDADWDGFYDRDDACPWQADEYGYGIDETGCPIEGTSDVTDEPTPEVTPEPTEPTPEVTPEPTEPTPEVTPVPTEPTPEVTPEPTEPTPEVTPEPTEPTPEVSPEPTEPTPEVTPEPTEPTPEVTPEPTEPTHEVTPEPTEPPRDNHPGRDTDGDGIPDNEDACPWAGNEGGYGVDETGCPFYDTDGDGFLDREDACPWQGDEGGIGVDETGCPFYDPEWDDVEDSNIEALDLDICWSSHPGSSVSQWRISNPDFPSVAIGRGTRVFFNWTVYDAPGAQGNIIDSGRTPFRDSPAVTQINTRYGQSLRIEWSIGRHGPISGVMVINADDTGRCDLPRVSLDGDGSGGIAPDYSTTYTEDQAPVDIQDDVNVSTPDNVTVSSATVTITNLLDGADEILAVNVGASGLTAAYANGILTISGDASPQTYQTVLDTLTYVNASQDPDETQRVVEVVIISNTVNSASVFAFVDVIAVNDAPVAGDDVASTDEDTSVNISVLDNDTDVEGDTLSVSQIISDPINGVAVIEVDGTITYTPDADYNGADSFVYEISDGNGGTDTANVTITINPVNDAPIANDDVVSVDEDNSINIDVLTNDTDIDGDTLSVVATYVGPSHGNVVIEADNTITYTPDADYNGADSFDYGISDGNGGVDIATVTITVNPVNDAPIANNDSFTVDEDGFLSDTTRPNDIDVEGDAIMLLAVDTQHGVLVPHHDGTFTYTPDPDFTGTDSFTYVLRDPDYPNTPQSVAVVTITVLPVNDAPVANDDSAVTSVNTSVTIPVLDNDTDVDGDNLNVAQIITDPTHGSVLIGPDDTITYSPDTDYFGDDTFTYEISDGNGGIDTATVSIQVGAPPVCTADAYAATGNISINTTNVAGNDVLQNDTGTSITVTEVQGVGANVGVNTATTNGGTVNMTATGEFAYDPPTGFTGADTFTYTIDNTANSPSTCTVTITVTDLIYFMDSAASTGGDGSLSNPFQSPDEHNFSVPANSILFIEDNGVAYSDILYLASGERVIGEGTTGTLFGGGSLTGITLATLSDPVPYNTTGNFADWAQFSTLGSVAILVNANNTLSGIDIGDTTGAGAITSGVNVGILTITESQITGQGATLHLTTGGTLNATFTNLISTSSNLEGLMLDGLGGNLTVTGTTAISGSSNEGIRVDNSPGGGTFDFGSTTVNVFSLNNAISMTGNTNTVTFDNLQVTTAQGVGLFGRNNTGALNVAFAATNDFNTDGSCIDLLNASGNQPININLDTCTATTGLTTYGIRLDNVGGTGLVIQNNTNIAQSGGTDAAISIADSTATLVDISDGATLTITNRRNSGIVLNNVTGAINFGTTTNNNASGVTHPAVSLTTVSSVVDFDSLTINQGNAGAGENFPTSFPADNAGMGDAVYANGATGLTVNGGIISNVKDDAFDWRNSGALRLNNVAINHQHGGTGTSGIQLYNSSRIAMIGGSITNFASATSVGGQRPLAVNILHDASYTEATGTFVFNSVDFNGGTGVLGGGIAQYLEDDASIEVNVNSGSTFTNVFGKAIITQNFSGAAGSNTGGAVTTRVINNFFNAPLSGGQSSVEVSSGGTGMSGLIAFEISNNTFSNFGDGQGTAILINLNQGGNARSQFNSLPTNVISNNTINDADAPGGIGIVIDETSGLRMRADNNDVDVNSVAFSILGLTAWTGGEVDVVMNNNDFATTSTVPAVTIVQDGGASTSMQLLWDDVDVNNPNGDLDGIEMYARGSGRLDFVTTNGDFTSSPASLETVYVQAGTNGNSQPGTICIDFNDDGGGANTTNFGFFFHELGNGVLLIENGTTVAAIIADNPGMNNGFFDIGGTPTVAECINATP